MPGKSELHEVEEAIRKHGVKDLARVAPANVMTAEWVRMKCRFGCGGYGKSLTCPPHSPTPQQTRRMLGEYETAYVLWWGSDHPPRADLAMIERDIFLLGYYKALLLALGPCHICDPCPGEFPCQNPQQARPAMEACGIDVFETARRAGFPLNVVTCREDAPNFYSLLLVQ